MHPLRGGNPPESPEFGGVPRREAPFGGVAFGGVPRRRRENFEVLEAKFEVLEAFGGVPRRRRVIRGGRIRGGPPPEAGKF